MNGKWVIANANTLNNWPGCGYIFYFHSVLLL